MTTTQVFEIEEFNAEPPTQLELDMLSRMLDPEARDYDGETDAEDMLEGLRSYDASWTENWYLIARAMTAYAEAHGERGGLNIEVERDSDGCPTSYLVVSVWSERLSSYVARTVRIPFTVLGDRLVDAGGLREALRLAGMIHEVAEDIRYRLDMTLPGWDNPVTV